MRASVSVCVCVFSPITQGRGKSFHFLDESLVSQKPRDLLLALCTASLFLSHSISIDFIHPIPRPLPSTPPLSLSFISFTPSSHFTFLSSCSTPTWRFPPPSPLNHTSISALHPFISHSLSLSFSLYFVHPHPPPPIPPTTHLCCCRVSTSVLQSSADMQVHWFTLLYPGVTNFRALLLHIHWLFFKLTASYTYIQYIHKYSVHKVTCGVRISAFMHMEA